MFAPCTWLATTSRLYGLGEAEGLADGVGEAEDEADEDEEVVTSVVPVPVEGVGDVVTVGSVSWVVSAGGSYVLVNKADNAIPTIIAANTNTGASTATKGTRRNGRTHPSMKYHSRAATTTSTATASHHGYPRTKKGRPATPLRLSAQPARFYRAFIPPVLATLHCISG